ncbi:hypothetical protein Golax_015310 [Gossypium laxum]|uniref:Uncharacterized protein n=1 Tax=Gossypium laxum TaxID=34288 RepID=A0A7J8ZXG0_9ROSI|nr:hypothetical protein [Gossypium laxum]
MHLLSKHEVFQQDCLRTNQHKTSLSHPPSLKQVVINENTETIIKRPLDKKTILKQVVINENTETRHSNEKAILLVEYYQLMQRITSGRLKKLEAEVEVCTNGKEEFDKVCKMLKENNK